MAIPVIQFLMSATPSLKTQCLEHDVSYLSFLTTSWLSQWNSSWTHYNGACHLSSWRNIGRVFFRKVNVSGSSWPHGKLSLICKVKLQHDWEMHSFQKYGTNMKMGLLLLFFDVHEVFIPPWWSIARPNLVDSCAWSHNCREFKSAQSYPVLR